MNDIAKNDISPGVFDLVTLPNGWVVGRFAALAELPGVAHAVTTRTGLDVQFLKDHRAEAAAAVAEAMGLQSVAFLKQVHGNEVLDAQAGGLIGDADGLTTDRPGLGLMAVGADCPLILAADRSGRAVGFAHASWRGTVKQIASRLVERLVERYGVRPADLLACICPSAGPQRYEVGPEVVAAAIDGIGPHARPFFIDRAGHTFMDLWSANRDQLLRAGLSDSAIHVAGLCTMTRTDLFPSYRVEGDQAGRLAAVIAKK